MTAATSDGDGLLAPVDFVAVEFPDGAVTADGFDRLLELADAGVIQVLDLEFVVADDAGARIVPLQDVPTAPGVDLGAWDGASSDLLDADDIALVGARMQPGSVAAVVVFENTWLHAVVEHWTRSGARMILDGAIPSGDLLDALDSAETS